MIKLISLINPFEKGPNLFKTEEQFYIDHSFNYSLKWVITSQFLLKIRIYG
ncbi:hypothetical protein NEF87_003220 [Candidatus Lokiarchaeum ossiferum]|uniref:Uncharacterized protein n=1 Tax=Candidatus Lokiarchaeum ossiferum TaxID=2951803 RepID=A0ABY6HTT5_9ARCH|nr:hypothetical protein NEF87_003220 [Candidatus Lokiarchaeum sp. B-35]